MVAAPLCACGCGEPAARSTKKRGGFFKYASGHWAATKEARRRVLKPCACGCGRMVFGTWYHNHHRKKHGDDPVQAKVNERLWRVYGITRADYEVMLEAQGGVCAICGTTEPGRDQLGRQTMFAVDHCHATGKVRALLCRLCNAGLGNFEDDAALVEKAAAYLRRHE